MLAQYATVERKCTCWKRARSITSALESFLVAYMPSEYPRQWVEVYRARHDRPKLLAALRDVTRGFVGITDMPGVHFIQELCEIYPEAKVVCVRRDPKRWLQSAQHMSNKMTAWYMPVLMWPMPAARWFSTWLELAVARTGEMGLLPFDEGECVPLICRLFCIVVLYRSHPQVLDVIRAYLSEQNIADQWY